MEDTATWKPYHRRSTDDHERRRFSLGRVLLYLVIILLVVGGVFVAKYGTAIFDEHNTMFTKLPALNDSVTTMGQRLDGTESKVQDWSSKWASFTSRFTGLEK